MKKLFDLYVMTLQRKERKSGTPHFIIKEWKGYYQVTREVACYLMWRNDCAYIIGWKDGKPMMSLKHDELHGIEYDMIDGRTMTYCIATWHREPFTGGDRVIYPQVNEFTCKPGFNFDRCISKALDFFRKNGMKTERSFQCDEWGALAFIPKGYYHVHGGGNAQIEEGDYYWNSDGRDLHYWQQVTDRSCARHRIGEKIRTISFNGKIYDDVFVIRKLLT